MKMYFKHLVVGILTVFTINTFVYSQTFSVDFTSNWYIQHVQAVDKDVAWAICKLSLSAQDLKLIRRTSIGEWILCQRNGLDTNVSYYGFYAIDSSIAYIANWKDVFKTTDGGDNWSYVISTWGSSGFINDIIFSKTDPNVGYILSDPVNGAGTPAPVFKTINGGSTWDTLFMNFGSGYYGLTYTASLYGTDHLFFSGNGIPLANINARIHSTSNGGANWFSFVLPGSNLAYKSIIFKENLTTGVVTCFQKFNKKAMRTTNGGQSWFETYEFHEWGDPIVRHAKSSNTWYLVDRMDFKKSINDGITWELTSTINNGSFNTFDITQEKDVVYGWMNGLPGTIHRMIDTVKLLSDISQIGEEIPSGYELKQNFPNPFNPETNLQFSIPRSGHVILKVYNSLGQVVNTLVDENLSQGVYNYSFDATGLSSGIYFYRLESADYVDVKRMVLIK